MDQCQKFGHFPLFEASVQSVIAKFIMIFVIFQQTCDIVVHSTCSVNEHCHCRGWKKLECVDGKCLNTIQSDGKCMGARLDLALLSGGVHP